MQYENVDSNTVADAWNYAKQGNIHTIYNIPEAREQLDRTANDLWESWTTDAEALDLVDAEIEAIGVIQMRCVLTFAYKLACRLSAESLFNPNFTLLIYSMRHLNSIGYELEPTIKAVAMELIGGSSARVDEAWKAARRVNAV